MKKVILLICICGVLFSCKTETEKNIEETDKLIQEVKVQGEAEQRTKEILEKSSKEFYTDTTGMGSSPVIVYKSKLVEKEYTNYKDIKLYYKNISKKNISAIRFEWYGENAFNEPADMGSYSVLGVGGGFTDDVLRVGASSSGVWEISSKDGKKIISARAYEVVFNDGSKWQLRKK